MLKIASIELVINLSITPHLHAYARELTLAGLTLIYIHDY